MMGSFFISYFMFLWSLLGSSLLLLEFFLLTGSEFVGWAGSVPGFLIGSGFALRSGSSPDLHSELLVLSSEFFFRVCSWFIYPSLEGLCVWIWCAAQFV
ncbi:hypothetical protein Hanom_Chr05g00411201 [Helianthus anomalus]